MTSRHSLWIVLLCAMGHAAGCAATKPPPRAAGVQERSAPASGMLAREYPRFATELGPLPGRVVGLVMPPESKWGRSLEWIGEQVASHPDAYVFPGGEKRAYQLYAAGLAPRVLHHAGAALLPGKEDATGLSGEAHLAEVTFGDGFGVATSSSFVAEATAVRVLDGEPGYPPSAARLLDAARAEFERFVSAQRPAIERLLSENKARFSGADGTSSAGRVTDVLYPYWDDARKTLVVLFHRRVMRIVQGSIPCQMVYEGMPPEPSSMPFRYGYGVELGQRVELDASGTLVGLTAFTPDVLRIASNVDLSGRGAGTEPCPGSPGLTTTGRYRHLELLYGRGEDGSAAPPESKCGNGRRDPDGQKPEECDAADLAGSTCRQFGYLGGQLRCSDDCTYHLDRCDPTAGPPARLIRRALDGSWGALAVLDGGRIAAIGARNHALTVLYLERTSVEHAAAKRVEWTLPEARGHGLEEPFAAAFGESLLIAAGRSAERDSLLLRVSPDGAVSDTGVTVPGRATFLVRRGNRALLGLIHGRQLNTVVVDSDGTLLGLPRAAVADQGGTGYVRGAAAATAGGWLVSVGSNGQYGAGAQYARLREDGVVLETGEVKAETGQVTVARGPTSTFVVQTHPAGVLATEVDDGGGQSAPRLVGRGSFSWIVSASVEGERLVVWASEGSGHVKRLELDRASNALEARTVLAVPSYIPVSTVFSAEERVHLFQAAPRQGGAVDRQLWLYAGP